MQPCSMSDLMLMGKDLNDAGGAGALKVRRYPQLWNYLKKTPTFTFKDLTPTTYSY